MTCNFCGSVLDDNEIECPYCGHKTGLGENVNDAPVEENEFEPETVTETEKGTKAKISLPKVNFNKRRATSKASVVDKESNVDYVPAAKGSKSFSMPNVAANSNFIPMVGFIACAILIIICLISIGNLKSKVESSNSALLGQIYQLQNSEQDINNRLDELSSALGTVNTTINEQSVSKNITIESAPTSAATYLGRGGSEDDTQNVPVFTVTAKGADLSFTWQIFDEASGSWINIIFDESSNNETYGLHLYTDANKGYSELAAHGITEAAYGSYRCQIADAYGTKTTDTVILTKREKA